MAPIQNITHFIQRGHLVLFPVDFSPSCAAMGPFVKREAAMFSAKVTLLHVLELSSSDSSSWCDRRQRLRRTGRRLLEPNSIPHLESEFPAHGCTRSCWWATQRLGSPR
jgi:hypothetical protein